MIQVFSWYLTITLLGLLTFPLAYRLLPNLPDRGYTFARPLGLLIWTYVFWILSSLHVLPNNPGGIFTALLVLVILSVLSLRNVTWNKIKTWSSSNKGLIIIAEGLFLAAFVGWSIVRAASPEITGTEKPMELAFINAILRSPAFPPHDPWLSGYAISYYYFGYVMAALLTAFTGLPSGITYNLTAALWFALTALSAFGITYSLLVVWGRKKGLNKNSSVSQAGWALLGPFFILIVSNFEGFLEMLHARGIFWQRSAEGSLVSGFWNWLDIQELTSPPAQPFTWIPERLSGIWWWRASRVLQDYTLSSEPREIIDEFPFFSYYLADIHPHVLAMPFVFLAVALALNLYLSGREGFKVGTGLFSGFYQWLVGKQENLNDLWILEMVRGINFWLAALVVGGLSFLNTWDFPIYVALFSAAFVLMRYEEAGWERGRRFVEFIELSLVLGLAGVLLYLPFYFGFASQAGGILPSLSFFTRGVHFWIMFGPLLVPVVVWLAWQSKENHSLKNMPKGLGVAALVVGGLWIFSYLMGFLAVILPPLANNLIGQSNSISGYFGGRMMEAANLFFSVQGSSSPFDLFGVTTLERLRAPMTWITLLVMLAFIWSLVIGFRKQPENAPLSTDVDQPIPYEPQSEAFVLLLVLVGCGLTLVPEFVYLRDQFGWRINTIFKFYFEAWMVWGIAAAFASAVLWQAMHTRWKYVWRISWIFVLLMAVAYPIFGLSSRLGNGKISDYTLDGTASIQQSNADEWAAIQWLKQAPLGVLAEAVGGSYSGFAQMSTQSGMPTVLGWVGHEGQWRGGSREMGSRESDIERLYHTADWNVAQEIIHKYNIRYIVVGPVERGAYRVNEDKFAGRVKRVFQRGPFTIYEVPGYSTAADPVMN